MTPTFVVGHRNPDTDSICAAIGYARFLQATGRTEVEAARCGDVNARTEFVLEHAGLPAPRRLLHVRATAGGICRREVVTIRENAALAEVVHIMQKHGLRSVPVVGETGSLCGIASLLRLLELVLPDLDDLAGNRRVEANLSKIATVLNGRFLCSMSPERDEVLVQMVGAMKARGFEEHMRAFPAEQLIIVCGNRPTVQELAIDYGVRCLIITGGYDLDPALLSRARENGVSVIISPWDTATTCLQIRSARGILPAIDRNISTVSEQEPIRNIRHLVQDGRQTLFPVVNHEGTMIGVFSRSDLARPDPIRLILVDHNELAQAVPGADEAQILEVIDHHRLGGSLISREPIRFINEPVGSTCTLIGRFYRQANLTPDRSTALCLVAGVIADTLTLTSPTTTEVDREVLRWLAETCDIDVDDFSEKFFAAGSVLEAYPPDQAVTMDCKEYTEGDWRFAVAQIEENGLDQFWERRASLDQALTELVSKNSYDFVCLMITDITRNNSLLLVSGNQQVIDVIDYSRRDDHLFELEAVVSRKKQLLPHLIHLLEGLNKFSPDEEPPANT
ncbi:MAG: putative manganese-dependent inorganic diphosphatase [Kiritimatiellae bacterium]|nr:putative manganese-dependent inorganic diphosphatase [Kiritimatiellia bacterium]